MMYVTVLDECEDGGCPAIVGFPELCTKRCACLLRDICLSEDEEVDAIEDEDFPF